MKIKFVTDSVADIPADRVERWGIEVVPCYVNYGGESYKDDGVELVRESYYDQLSTMDDYPSTAAMSPDLARQYIDRAAQDADHVVMITTPAKLSGIHNAFRLGAAHLPPEHYTLIDSGQLSIGIGWQVLGAAEVAAETGDLDKTLKAVDAIRDHMNIYATVGSLEFLRRSGRIGWAMAGIGTLLNIKPVVYVQDGEIDPITRVRTFKRAMDKLVELARQHAPYERLAILHINNPDGAAVLRSALADLAPENTLTGLIGPALGTHIGPGSVGIGTISKGWKEHAIST
jgi:DegV family protein with EDD domain